MTYHITVDGVLTVTTIPDFGLARELAGTITGHDVAILDVSGVQVWPYPTTLTPEGEQYLVPGTEVMDNPDPQGSLW